jgi:hypothetical protein
LILVFVNNLVAKEITNYIPPYNGKDSSGRVKNISGIIAYGNDTLLRRVLNKMSIKWLLRRQ